MCRDTKSHFLRCPLLKAAQSSLTVSLHYQVPEDPIFYWSSLWAKGHWHICSCLIILPLDINHLPSAWWSNYSSRPKRWPQPLCLIIPGVPFSLFYLLYLFLHQASHLDQDDVLLLLSFPNTFWAFLFTVGPCPWGLQSQKERKRLPSLLQVSPHCPLVQAPSIPDHLPKMWIWTLSYFTVTYWSLTDMEEKF